MDQPASYADLRACLKDIARINLLLRAHEPIIAWLDHVCEQLPRQHRPLHIVDVGSGYGDLLRRIHTWAEAKKLAVTLTGIDLNPDAVRAAREVTVPGTVLFETGNAFEYRPSSGIDLIVSSLTTHHMEDDEIVACLRWMERTARLGWFINDLHRHPMPYHLFRALANVMPLHRFARNDGAVSILRSFRHEDWWRLGNDAGLPPESYKLLTYRPARLCVARLRSLGKPVAAQKRYRSADAAAVPEPSLRFTHQPNGSL